MKKIIYLFVGITAFFSCPANAQQPVSMNSILDSIELMLTGCPAFAGQMKKAVIPTNK